MIISLKKSTIIFFSLSVLLIIFSTVLRLIGVADADREIMGIMWTGWLALGVLVLVNDSKEMCFKYTFLTLLIGEILLLLNYKFNIFASNSSDSLNFIEISREYYNGDFSDYRTRFPYVINFSYHIFGLNEYIVYQLGLVMTSLSVLFSAKIMDTLEIVEWIQNGALLLMTISPFKFIYGGSILREPIYILFVTISFYYYVLWKKNNRRSYFGLAIIMTLPAVYLHSGLAMVTVSYIIMELFSKEIKPFNRLFIIVLLSFALFAVRSSRAGYFIFNGISGLINYYETGYSQYADSTIGSMYLSWMHPINILQLILYTPLRMIYFWFSPLPDQWNSFSRIATFLFDSSIYIISFISIIEILKYKINLSELQRRIFNTLIVVLLLYSVVFSWGTIASGTAVRHRNCMVNLCIITIALAKMSRIQQPEIDLSELSI